MRNFRQNGESMTTEEILTFLKRERFKAAPDAPVPQWMTEKNDEKVLNEFRLTNSYKYESLDYAIKCIEAVNAMKKVGID